VKFRIFAFLSVVVLLFAAPSFAVSSGNCDATLGDGSPWSITCHFTPGPSGNATFDFSPQGDGIMTMQFETVLTPFDVTLTATEFFDGIPNPLDPNEFPNGTVCIKYFREQCVRYDFSGNATSGGLDNVPVKGVDYRGLITLTLNYNKSATQPVQIPAFAHAPGLNSDLTTFSEDILTSYADTNAPCPSCDPAMGGKTPGISPFAPFYKPLPTAPSFVCSLTATYQTTTSDTNPIVEVAFKLVAPGGNCSTGPFLRDKTASLSVTLSSDPISFADLINGGDSNKFHFDNKNNTNVQDINTNKLPPGNYIVTVRSNLFAPVDAPSFKVPNTP